MKRGLLAQLTAGHSLGEYSALVASGGLAFRGCRQDRSPPGSIHAGGCSCRGREPWLLFSVWSGKRWRDSVEEAVGGEVLAPANFNSPGQIVISGHTQAVERAIERVKQKGKKAMLLPVSAPFHSPLMKGAGDRLAKELEPIPVGDLKIPVVTNVEAEINQDRERVKALLVAQVSSPVRWEDSMKRMVDEGIETGPRNRSRERSSQD